MKYFLAYGTSAEVALLTLDAYVSVVLKILMGFGICFELPVIIVLLAELGVLSADQLEKKQRRIAVIVIAIISAIVAPPDAISMLMLMAPLYLLFEGSIVVVKFLHKRRLEKNTAKS